MPTYEYACRECGQHLEVVQSFKDEALTTCGTCGGSLRKVFSAAGIIFKGSGYYVTDTRQKQAKSAGEGKTAKADKGSQDGKSDGGESSPSTAESGAAKANDSKADSSKPSEQRGTAESA